MSKQSDQKLKPSFSILARESPTPNTPTSYSSAPPAPAPHIFICSTVDLVSAVGRPSRPSSEPLSGPLTFSASENYFRITLSNVFMASPRDLCIQAEILSYQREWALQMRRKSENKLSRNLASKLFLGGSGVANV